MRSIEVIVAVIRCAGRVLISRRRSDDPFGGYWEFPGGKRERDETPDECLVRELWEELAMTVRPVARLTPIEHDYDAVRVRLIPYLCDASSADPQPLASDQLLWVDPPALREYRFPEANGPLIEEVIRRLAPPVEATHDD